jgi:hypothetical protein
MSDQTPDATTRSSTQPEKLIARLKTPMTVTLPAWAFGAAGVAALLLVIVALD